MRALLTESIIFYFEAHKQSLFAARQAISSGNGSLAYEILGNSINTIDEMLRKLKS